MAFAHPFRIFNEKEMFIGTGEEVICCIFYATEEAFNGVISDQQDWNVKFKMWCVVGSLS